MGEKDKAQYEAKATKDKERYEAEKRAYNVLHLPYPLDFTLFCAVLIYFIGLNVVVLRHQIETSLHTPLYRVSRHSQLLR